MFKKVRTDTDQDVIINTSHIAYAMQYDDVFEIGLSGGVSFSLDKKSREQILELMSPKKQVKKSDDLGPLFQELYTLTGGKGAGKFTEQRHKKLKNLLTKQHLTPDDLRTAATNIGKDDFLQGSNDNNKRYGDIDYLLRPDKAARWAEHQAKKKTMF